MILKNTTKNYIFIAFFLLLTLVGCKKELPEYIALEYDNLPEKIDYNMDVKPILSDRCFLCHGPDKDDQKAGLRLDTPEGAYKAFENKSGAAIVPGKVDKSHAYLRIISEDPNYIMPPPYAHLELTAREKAIVTKWIEQGAVYKPHWSFIPIDTAAVLPTVKDKSEVRQPIDNFVISKLEKNGLSLSKQATKETLIRRVSFDLTGLPPTIAEIDAFLKDTSLNAYEKVIDRLLASKAYGERMTANWLDVARYADSDGYLDDKHRDFSPWRDWVIDAFNKNMPYDAFVTWQLAGDLLPNATQETILATAFNRLNKRNSEGGIVYEEFRVEYAADRTNTVGKAFMGMSVECARCHDHKYDPISQRDYYEISGFFNATDEIGSAVYGPDQTPGPALLLASKEEQTKIDLLKQTISDLEKQVNTSQTEQFKQWQSNHQLTSKKVENSIQHSLVAYYPFDKITSTGKETAKSPNLKNTSKPAVLFQPVIKPGKKGNAFFGTEYNSLSLGEKVGWYERTDPFTVQLWIKSDTLYKEASIFGHSEERRLGLKGYSLTLRDNKLEFILSHSWPQNAIQVTSKNTIPKGEWALITIAYDGSSKANGVTIYINGDQQEVTMEYDNLYKSILYKYDIHTYGFKGLSFGLRSKFTPFKGGGIDDVKVYNRDLSALEVLYTFDKNKGASIIQTGTNQKMIQDYYTSVIDKNELKLHQELQDVREEENELLSNIQEIMVMGDLPEPRTTYILERGIYDAHGDTVQPGIPERIFTFDASLPKNRLGLSKWLFDKKNPLTARVYVNRIWQMHFGKGIVKTAEDFGAQGSLPTHLELLDWLANDFQNHDWDIKYLHKKILTSATFMQTSNVSKELLEKDPENDLLARGPRFRLPAEMVRDNALAISGLLVDEIGGKSVYPYQPAGIWDELTNKSWAYKYLQEPGDGLYRRSMYTFWKRQSPPPSMVIFDIADRGVCTVRRKSTSTPLQALVLLNDPQFVEASQVLASKLIKEETDVTKRLDVAFRMVTGRVPDQKEKSILEEFYSEELRNFTKHKDKAVALLNTGEYTWKKDANPSEIAALGVVVNAMMNTEEGFTNK